MTLATRCTNGGARRTPAAANHQNTPNSAAMLKAAEGLKKAGDLRASYVYDRTTGLKIFGHVAFYVKAKDGTVPFMRKTDAEQFSKSAGGRLVGSRITR